jgi:peptidoglycan/xylan/chitin deacetylase (PgdA/CDA1 family)
MTWWRVPLALCAALALSLEVPSFLGATGVESSGQQPTTALSQDTGNSPAETPSVTVTYEDIVSDVLSEPDVDDQGFVDCGITPCVALSFDDGPGPYTADILAILDQFNAGATFYLVGHQIDNWPRMVPLIRDAGQDIGNHTVSHPKLGSLSTSAQRREITDLDRVLADRFDVFATTVRPPFGDLPDGDLPDPHQRPVVLWSVDSLDWRKRTTAAIVDEVLADVGAGDIILMHELYQRSVDALPEILTELAARGLTVVSVADLLGSAVFQPGIVEHVPFVCPPTTDDNESPVWCVENPNWTRQMD